MKQRLKNWKIRWKYLLWYLRAVSKLPYSHRHVCKALCAHVFAIWGEIFCEHSFLQQPPCGLTVTEKKSRVIWWAGSFSTHWIRTSRYTTTHVTQAHNPPSPITWVEKTTLKSLHTGEPLHLQKLHSITMQPAHVKSLGLDTPIKQKYKYQENWILNRL